MCCWYLNPGLLCLELGQDTDFAVIVPFDSVGETNS